MSSTKPSLFVCLFVCTSKNQSSAVLQKTKSGRKLTIDKMKFSGLYDEVM